MSKICTKCGEEKPFANFNKDKAKKDGHNSHCNLCRSKYMKRRHSQLLSRPLAPHTKEKYCPKCEQVRPAEAFTNNPATASGLNGYCRRCYTRMRYSNKLNHMRGYLETTYGKIPCNDCGGVFPWECIDFDHNTGAEKRFNVCSYKANCIQTPERIAIIEEEIKNCTIVCSNCHRTRTVKRAEVKRWADE